MSFISELDFICNICKEKYSNRLKSTDYICGHKIYKIKCEFPVKCIQKHNPTSLQICKNCSDIQHCVLTKNFNDYDVYKNLELLIVYESSTEKYKHISMDTFPLVRLVKQYNINEDLSVDFDDRLKWIYNLQLMYFCDEVVKIIKTEVRERNTVQKIKNLMD